MRLRSGKTIDVLAPNTGDWMDYILVVIEKPALQIMEFFVPICTSLTYQEFRSLPIEEGAAILEPITKEINSASPFLLAALKTTSERKPQ